MWLKLGQVGQSPFWYGLGLLISSFNTVALKVEEKMSLNHVHYSATLVGPTLRAHCTRRQTAWTECLVASDPVTSFANSSICLRMYEYICIK